MLSFSVELVSEGRITKKKKVDMRLFVVILLSLTTQAACLISPATRSSWQTTPRNGVSVATETAIDRSTLTLLEHVNINVPDHKYIIQFYFGLLGCGVDPRKAINILEGSKTVWANCGASQFHLPFGETAQVIPGQIGLRYDSLDALRDRLDDDSLKDCYASSEVLDNGSIKIVDVYGNVFYCRQGTSPPSSLKQPLVSKKDTDEFGDVALKYGCDESECRGIDYVEINCPTGTAEKIALFYDSVLDATTSLVEHDGKNIAIIAFGDVNADGRASQSLLFRETNEPLPPYDGHHLAMYVGESRQDFEQAFQNADMAGIIWVNPRFSDKASTLQGAKQWKQFRFKDIVDMETGKTIMELEHEMRSIEHSAWPGM